MKKIAAFPAEKARERKKRIGSIGSGARSSRAMNATTSSRPAASAPTDLELSQATDSRAPAPNDPEGGGADQPKAGQVEAGVATEALLDPGGDERDRGQADGDIEPEDPLPGDPLDDRAAGRAGPGQQSR